MDRRGLFQALAGLVVAGSANAGSHDPQLEEIRVAVPADGTHIKHLDFLLKTSNPMTATAFSQARPCPVCKRPALAAKVRLAEIEPRDNTRCFDIMGVVYMHPEGPPCDLPMQTVSPLGS